MEDATCPICFDALEFPIELNCKHAFCPDCYRSWNERSNLCPMCKAVIEEPQLALESSIKKVTSLLDHTLCFLEKIKTIKSHIPEDCTEHQELKTKLGNIVTKMNELGISPARPSFEPSVALEGLDAIGQDIMASIIALGNSSSRPLPFDPTSLPFRFPFR